MTDLILEHGEMVRIERWYRSDGPGLPVRYVGIGIQWEGSDDPPIMLSTQEALDFGVALVYEAERSRRMDVPLGIIDPATGAAGKDGGAA